MRDHLSTGSVNINCTEMLGNFLNQENDNGAALLNLVERYVDHFARRYNNLNFYEQQDIQQEVALKLLCHGEKVRENCSRSWVYTVVRNQCINHVRQRETQLSFCHYSGDPESMAAASGKTPTLNNNFDLSIIGSMDCLQKIFKSIEVQKTGKEDIAIYTQYAFGLTYAEISKRSKRTVAAIGNRISTLKRRLKKLAKEYC